ncbi:MAG: response regulator transcription factor [Deltaproteobacteria bacterium]|nr:response regulator transcription factor [Deltaproteobacteria bacterium]
MKVLIVDDHAVVREGLKQILADDPEIGTVGEAGDARQMKDNIRNEKWDVVVLDITLPGQSGLEALKDLKQAHPELPVLVLSMHPENQFAVRVLKAGADGYINKETAPKELLAAVKKVFGGGKYVSPRMAENLIGEVQGNVATVPHQKLSDREYEVLRLIASGKKPGEIAADLSLSVKTVSTYRERILQKMGLKTNAELTRYALENHLIE